MFRWFPSTSNCPVPVYWVLVAVSVTVKVPEPPAASCPVIVRAGVVCPCIVIVPFVTAPVLLMDMAAVPFFWTAEPFQASLLQFPVQLPAKSATGVGVLLPPPQPARNNTP